MSEELFLSIFAAVGLVVILFVFAAGVASIVNWIIKKA